MGKFSLRTYRPPDQQPYRAACNWMLISVALAIGLHLARLPLWLTTTSLCLLLWRYLIENHAWRIPSRWFRWLLLIVTAVAVYRYFGTLLGRDASVGFLAVLIGLKIIEIRSLRDYLVTMFLTYLLVMSHFLHSQSLTSALYAALVIAAATHTMVLLNRSTPVRASHSIRLVFIILVQSLPLLIAMYFLFPRIQGSLWGLPHDIADGRTGMSEEVSPGTINSLYQDSTISFRARFAGPRPPPNQLYWRAFVLSESDGRTWSRHRGAGDGLRRWQYQGIGGALEYVVTLEPHHQNWVPVLDLPRRASAKTLPAPGYVLEARRKVRQRREFELSSHLRYTTGPPSRRELKHNREWRQTPSNRIKRLVETWRAGADNDVRLVQTALQHFRQQPFRYTLTPPLLGSDPVDEFMFDSQAGYCEHYASAFTALMRLSGVPARVVVGYQGGEWNQAGNYFIVRQSDAHAWSEVWLESTGWTRVDPTAAVAPERIELGARALRDLAALGNILGSLGTSEVRRLITPGWLKQAWRQVQWNWDALNTRWDKWLVAYGPQMQRQLLKLLGFKTPDWTNTVMTLCAALVALLLIISAVFLYQRRPRDPVLEVYLRFCKKLRRAGFSRDQHEGPLAFSSRLLQSRPDLQRPVNAITWDYINLRYRAYDPQRLARMRTQVARFSPGTGNAIDSSSRS